MTPEHRNEVEQLVRQAAAAASEKKAERVVVLDVSRQLVITDFFLVCSGNTTRQVRAIAEEVERFLLESHGVKPFRTEGTGDASWILLDYVDFVVHVFTSEQRDYYSLERLWSDAMPREGLESRAEGEQPEGMTQTADRSFG